MKRIATIGFVVSTLVVVGGWQLVHTYPAYAQTPANIKLLVILVNFTDAPNQPITLAQAKNIYFGSTGSVNAYYQADSNNRISFSGDVVGWYTVARDTGECGSVLAPAVDTWSKAGLKAAITAGVDPSQYSLIQYVFSDSGGGTCGKNMFAWTSMGTPGKYPPPLGKVTEVAGTYYFSGLESWISGGGTAKYYVASIFAHEIGHDLGSAHASTPSSQYGDYSDVMGDQWQISGYKPMESNAPHEINFGWIDPGEVQTITTSGTYTINALESNTGIRILKIAQKSAPSFNYYISMRQAIDIDANMPAAYLNGANVHRWDGKAATASYFLSRLTDGQTFTDSASGVTIKQISHTASTATVDVTISTPCTQAQPTVTTSPVSSISGPPGLPTSFTITITNRNGSGCTASNFAVNYTPSPAGWTGSISVPTLSIPPGQSKTTTVSITPPFNAQTGKYFTQYYNIAQDGTVFGYYAMSFYTTAVTCASAAPTLTATPTTYSTSANTPESYTLTLVNKDSASCPASSFVLTPQVPSGWTANVSTPVTTLAPGDSGTTVATLTSPVGQKSGTTTISMKVTDAATSVHTVSTGVAYGVIPPPACVRVAPVVTPTPTSYNNASAGDTKQYTVTVLNKDNSSCPSSTFSLTPQAPPAGWNISTTPANYVIAPGTEKIFAVSVQSPLTQPSGKTTIKLTTIDGAVSEHTTVIPIDYEVPATCVRGAPVLTLAPLTKTGNAGDTLSYLATLANTDSEVCGSTLFTLSSIVPSGWSSSITPSSLLVEANFFGSFVLSVTSPSTATLQDYGFSIAASGANHTPVSQGATYTVGVVTPLPVSQDNLSISATRVRKGGPSTLTWWVSGGLKAGVNCSISPASQIQMGSPTSITGSATVTNWGSSSNPITAQTVSLQTPILFTLSCTDGASSVSKNATINFIPAVQEI